MVRGLQERELLRGTCGMGTAETKGSAPSVRGRVDSRSSSCQSRRRHSRQPRSDTRADGRSGPRKGQLISISLGVPRRSDHSGTEPSHHRVPRRPALTLPPSRSRPTSPAGVDTLIGGPYLGGQVNGGRTVSTEPETTESESVQEDAIEDLEAKATSCAWPPTAGRSGVAGSRQRQRRGCKWFVRVGGGT